ncbi:MAG: outer membrane lipoprotein carrier protein LolA [Deltaproteobacteria bacterium]|jgi:outer membrane lipoprotein carrier protein|nr:outer membrane lipoprotein carrier protein LolA [Deltaproteobacteria bacterium]
MKKVQIHKIFVIAVFLLTVYMCIGWADSWEELSSAAGTVTSVKAEFVQEKHMKILARPLVSEGILLFQGPDSLRWEYTQPIQSILLLHNGKTRRFVQKDGNLIEDASASLQSMQVVVQEITQWLNGRFDDNPAFAARLEPGRKIVMTPREESFARLIQRIEIILSDRPAVITSVMIFENADSYTKLNFKDVILNQKLDDRLFREVK